jgi:CubicO group peptidase (beta-lactamase class C family)
MTDDPPRSTRRTVLKGLALGTAACVLGDVAAVTADGGGRGRRLPRVRPEEVGIAPAAILAFVDAVEQKVGGLHSFMLLRHGQVAAEGWWAPYAARYPHMLFSLSKSFASTAVGLAVAEGRLTVDAPVLSFFPEDVPATVSENLAAMRVRHLLSMSTGHDKDATGPTTRAPDGNWVKAFLSLPVEHAPGTHFVYNSAATYLCSAIVQKQTGVTLLEYLRPRLFGPLGIEGPTWETCPRGISIGGWGLSVKTEDVARFGQLYLQKGRWNGRLLLPETWVEEATRKQVSNGTSETSDWNQGYGYQFWRCRHGAYRGDGAFGQFCIVMPPQDAVLAITSGVGDMQAVMNAAWEHLLPAMPPEPAGNGAAAASGVGRPTPASASAGSDAAPDLKRKLAALSVPLPEGRSPAPPTAGRVSGRTCRFEVNEEKIQSAALTFKGNRCRLTLRDEKERRPIECGSGAWAKGTTDFGARQESKIAASGAWTDDETYTIQICFYETPFIQTMTWKFVGDQVTVTRKTNVGFGPTERPTLKGRLE